MDNYNLQSGSTAASEAEGKTAGIVSYLTIIGWLVAYFAMHKDKKTAIGSYQLRQTLLFYIVGFALGILFNILVRVTGSMTVVYVYYAVMLVMFILWLIGIIGAANGQKKPMPLIGAKAQSTFPNI